MSCGLFIISSRSLTRHFQGLTAATLAVLAFATPGVATGQLVADDGTGELRNRLSAELQSTGISSPAVLNAAVEFATASNSKLLYIVTARDGRRNREETGASVVADGPIMPTVFQHVACYGPTEITLNNQE